MGSSSSVSVGDGVGLGRSREDDDAGGLVLLVVGEGDGDGVGVGVARCAVTGAVVVGVAELLGTTDWLATCGTGLLGALVAADVGAVADAVLAASEVLAFDAFGLAEGVGDPSAIGVAFCADADADAAAGESGASGSAVLDASRSGAEVAEMAPARTPPRCRASRVSAACPGWAASSAATASSRPRAEPDRSSTGAMAMESSAAPASRRIGARRPTRGRASGWVGGAAEVW